MKQLVISPCLSLLHFLLLLLNAFSIPPFSSFLFFLQFHAPCGFIIFENTALRLHRLCCFSPAEVLVTGFSSFSSYSFSPVSSFSIVSRTLSIRNSRMCLLLTSGLLLGFFLHCKFSRPYNIPSFSCIIHSLIPKQFQYGRLVQRLESHYQTPNSYLLVFRPVTTHLSSLVTAKLIMHF